MARLQNRLSNSSFLTVFWVKVVPRSIEVHFKIAINVLFLSYVLMIRAPFWTLWAPSGEHVSSMLHDVRPSFLMCSGFFSGCVVACVLVVAFLFCTRLMKIQWPSKPKAHRSLHPRTGRRASQSDKYIVQFSKTLLLYLGEWTVWKQQLPQPGNLHCRAKV